MVSAVVSATQDVEHAVAVDLSALLSPLTETEKARGGTETKKTTGEGAVASFRGVLPHLHLGDHASLCNETLAAKLTPGTRIDRLLVLELDRRGVPVVSLKPLLLSSVRASSSSSSSSSSKQGHEAFIPRGPSDLSPGDVVAGFVSRVESFGVFVKFFGRFTALCPRSMSADRRVEDTRGMFDEGDSVR